LYGIINHAPQNLLVGFNVPHVNILHVDNLSSVVLDYHHGRFFHAGSIAGDCKETMMSHRIWYNVPMKDNALEIRAKADELWEMGFKEMSDQLHQLAREVERRQRDEFEANHSRLTAKGLLDALIHGFDKPGKLPWKKDEGESILREDDVVVLKERHIIFYRRDEKDNYRYIFHVAALTDDPVPLEERDIPYINQQAREPSIPVDVNEWVKVKLENGEENPYALGPPKVKAR